MKKVRKIALDKIIKIVLSVILVICFVGAAITSAPALAILPFDTMLLNYENLLVKYECTPESFTRNHYSMVYIVNAEINDMSFFDDLTVDVIEFENCDFRGCQINLPESVTSVSFRNCNIDDFTGLDDNQNIYSFTLNSCKVRSIEGLRNLENLLYLTIWYVGIEDIEELANLNNLIELTLLQTYVKSIEPLRNSSIERLDVSESLNITDFSPIKDMKNLNSFIAENGQMALTEDILNYLNANGIEHIFTKEDLEYKNQVKQIANNIFVEGMTDEAKIEAIVNYVADSMVYDDRGPEDGELLSEFNSNALKYALKGTGCCRNYTALTTVLLQEADIEVYEVLNDGHIWNLVLLDGKYYWLDVTLVDSHAFENVKESSGYMTDDFDMLGTEYPGILPQSYYEKICDSPNDEAIGIPPSIDIDYNDDYMDVVTYSYIEDDLAIKHIPFGVAFVVSFVAIILVSIVFKSVKKKKAKKALAEQSAEININI